uniref:Uncharacterized protein n=1 Tax=Anguilla anguilla TaxID=7936 RepID=A0A0E9UWN3_ANGAN
MRTHTPQDCAGSRPIASLCHGAFISPLFSHLATLPVGDLA